jgi:hypothetical protein
MRRRYPAGAAPQSVLVPCTVQTIGMFPIDPVDEMVVPFMNQITVLPLVSRQRRSLSPSPF